MPGNITPNTNDKLNNDGINNYTEPTKEKYEIVDYETWDEIEELQDRTDILRGFIYAFE